MALTDEVQSRISATRLKQLTNPDESGDPSLDTTLLGKACTDVEMEFQLHAGVLYDNDNGIHVSLAVSGVVAKLQEWTGNGGEWASAHRKRYEDGLKLLRDRQGVPATSSSVLTPEAEVSGQRPKLDPGALGRYTAEPFGRGDSDPLGHYPGIGL